MIDRSVIEKAPSIPEYVETVYDLSAKTRLPAELVSSRSFDLLQHYTDLCKGENSIEFRHEEKELAYELVIPNAQNCVSEQRDEQVLMKSIGVFYQTYHRRQEGWQVYLLKNNNRRLLNIDAFFIRRA